MNTDELQKITIYEGKQIVDKFPYDDWEKIYEKRASPHLKDCKRCQEWEGEYDYTYEDTPTPMLQYFLHQRLIKVEIKKLLSQGIFDFKVIEGHIWTKDGLRDADQIVVPEGHTWIELEDGTAIDPPSSPINLRYAAEGGIVVRMNGDVRDINDNLYASLEGEGPHYASQFTPLLYLFLRSPERTCMMQEMHEQLNGLFTWDDLVESGDLR